MHSRHVFAFLFFILVLVAQGCRPSVDPGTIEVRIVPNASQLQEEAFSPNPAIVPVGKKITWVNDDNVSHTVTGNAPEGPCAFDSGEIAPGKSFSRTFPEPVRCGYSCRLHGRAMRGRMEIVLSSKD
jgi:plastocyanin